MDAAQSTTPASSAADSAAPAAPTVNDAAAALAFADSSLATPEPPVDASAATGEPPVETPAPEPASSDPLVDDPRSPTIPRPRFDEVNGRMQKAEEALKRYDWAKDFAPDDLHSVATWAKALKASPVEAALHLLSTLEADPQHAAQLRSHAARTLAAGRQPAQPAADPMPEPDLQAQDGTLVYSAPQQTKLREWDQRQLTATLTKSFEEKLQPLTKVAKTFEQREAQAAYTSTTGQAIAALKAKDPAFATHLPQVWAVLETDPQLMQMALAPETAALAIRAAWGEVYRTTVVPQQLKDSEGKTLASLQQRAVAATANPAAAGTSTPVSTLGNARAALLAAGVEER